MVRNIRDSLGSLCKCFFGNFIPRFFSNKPLWTKICKMLPLVGNSLCLPQTKIQIFWNFTYDDCNIQIACIISISAQCALTFKPILLILIWRWYEDWSSYELNSYSIYLIGYGIHSVLIKHQYVQITLYLANICLYNLTYVYVYYVSQETLLILRLQIYTYMCKFTMNWIPIAAKGAIIYINSSLFCTQCLISYAIIFQQ